MTETPFPFSQQPGDRTTSWMPAAPGEVYAPGAFDRSVGQIIVDKYGDVPVGHSRIIAAEVAEDGSGVTLTLEVVDRDEATS
jgi:hypothetical protein